MTVLRLSQEVMDDFNGFRVVDYIGYALEDSMVLAVHKAQGTHPRICDMQTSWSRRKAWELFWENGRYGL